MNKRAKRKGETRSLGKNIATSALLTGGGAIVGAGAGHFVRKNKDIPLSDIVQIYTHPEIKDYLRNKSKGVAVMKTGHFAAPYDNEGSVDKYILKGINPMDDLNAFKDKGMVTLE